jgi:hypothetical protein
MFKIIGKILLAVLLFIVSLVVSSIFAIYPTMRQLDCGAWGSCWEFHNYAFFILLYLAIQAASFFISVKWIKLRASIFFSITLCILLLSLTVMPWLLGFSNSLFGVGLWGYIRY